MRQYLLLIFLFSLITGWTQPQPLKRRASLGVLLETVNDSIARANDLPDVKGVYISRVFPNTTAEKMGIKQGDILIKTNTKTTHSIGAVLEAIQNLRADDAVELTYYRNGTIKTSTGKAIPRPIETSEYATVTYGQVTYEGNRLRSILHVPHHKKNPPVVYFLQGYLCQTVELTAVPDHPIRKLIDDWVKAGFAVYRIEKPGMGDSDCNKGCYDLNFNEETEAFRQGYKQLKTLSTIDTDNVFLFGHSIGGIIAPLLAPEFNPKGIITYGTLVQSWFEYLKELTVVQGEIFGLPDTEIQTNLKALTPFWKAMLIEKQSPEELLKNKDFYTLLQREGTLTTFQNEQLNNRHYSYWTTIQDIDLAQAWEKVHTDVLALHGSLDIQALNARAIHQIAGIVNAHHPGKAKAIVIKGADHGFTRFKTMQENVNTLNTNNYMTYAAQHYHTEIAETSIAWMKHLIN